MSQKTTLFWCPRHGFLRERDPDVAQGTDGSLMGNHVDGDIFTEEYFCLEPYGHDECMSRLLEVEVPVPAPVSVEAKDGGAE